MSDIRLYRDRDLLTIVNQWADASSRFATATVISTWGSAPREVGALMIIHESRQFFGSVSGGCVENAVVEAALESIDDGQPRLIEFGISDEDVLSIGLACGGQIQILIEPSTQLTSHWVTHALETTRQRLSSTFVREMNSLGSQNPIENAYWLNRGDVDHGSATRLDQQRSLFIQSFRPERRVIIIGGVHIAQALVQGLAAIDLTVVIVDPREVWANPERFPDVEIRNQWPDDALSALGVDPDTAVIALTHDPKFDDPALAIALKSEAFYIGALGGSKSAKSRRERLLRLGLTDSEIDRLHSPIGLPIGAKGPSEITVSILADVIASYRNVACD